jgi:hypothetical protein
MKAICVSVAPRGQVPHEQSRAMRVFLKNMSDPFTTFPRMVRAGRARFLRSKTHRKPYVRGLRIS